MESEVEIIPAADRVKETVRLLLELAEKKRHVRMNYDGGTSFLVPIYLHKRYLEAINSPKAPLPVAALAYNGGSTPKRRGRPPKPRPEYSAIGSQDKE